MVVSSGAFCSLPGMVLAFSVKREPWEGKFWWIFFDNVGFNGCLIGDFSVKWEPFQLNYWWDYFTQIMLVLMEKKDNLIIAMAFSVNGEP